MKVAYWASWADINGRAMPPWYGIAWQDPIQSRVLLALVPLNRILSLARDLILWGDRWLRGDLSWSSHAAVRAYQKGWADGGADEVRKWIKMLPDYTKMVRDHGHEPGVAAPPPPRSEERI